MWAKGELRWLQKDKSGKQTGISFLCGTSYSVYSG